MVGPVSASDHPVMLGSWPASSSSTTSRTSWRWSARTSAAKGMTSPRRPTASARSSSPPSSHRTCIVLDVMLPRRSGFEVLRELRARGSDAAVILLTARDDLVDRVAGLEIGADDYVTKPFEPRELVARVSAVLRRTEGSAPGFARRPAGGGTRAVLRPRDRPRRQGGPPRRAYRGVDPGRVRSAVRLRRPPGHRPCRAISSARSCSARHSQRSIERSTATSRTSATSSALVPAASRTSTRCAASATARPADEPPPAPCARLRSGGDPDGRGDCAHRTDDRRAGIRGGAGRGAGHIRSRSGHGSGSRGRPARPDRAAGDDDHPDRRGPRRRRHVLAPGLRPRQPDGAAARPARGRRRVPRRRPARRALRVGRPHRRARFARPVVRRNGRPAAGRRGRPPALPAGRRA